MINLLPDATKKELRAARTNVRLLNYILMLGLGVLFLIVVCGGVYLTLSSSKSSADSRINENQSKSSSYGSVEAQGAELRSSLTNAKTILDQEVLYTKVITRFADLVPEGVVINSLNLSPSTFGAPVNLQIYAKSNEAALSLKDKLQSSNLFSNINFQSLSSNAQSNTYPVSATLSIVINKSAAQ